MSHHTVLVIGPDPELQLAPFDENLQVCDSPKWDWYIVGGRWRGFFKLKAGAVGHLGEPGVFDNLPRHDRGADVATLSDIDWDAMSQEAGDAAAQEWDAYNQATLGLPFIPFEVVRSTNPDLTIDNQRKLYWGQEALEAIKLAKLSTWDVEHILTTTRGQFVARAMISAGVPFAVVKDGEWYEKGSMGWWGMVADEKDGLEWARQFGDLIDGLPPETLVTLYDCHSL